MVEYPIVTCPRCEFKKDMNLLLTAQSNQNVIYECPRCGYEKRNIVTKKG